MFGALSGTLPKSYRNGEPSPRDDDNNKVRRRARAPFPTEKNVVRSLTRSFRVHDKLLKLVSVLWVGSVRPYVRVRCLRQLAY